LTVVFARRGGGVRAAPGLEQLVDALEDEAHAVSASRARALGGKYS
jgi:hypothetical protein